MSISQKITSVVDKHIGSFIQQLSSMHGLPEDELWELWSGEKGNPKKNPKAKKETKVNEEPVKVDPNSTDPEVLNKLVVPVLKSMCKDRGLKAVGTKKVLVDILCGVECDIKNDVKGKIVPSVIKKINSVIPVISIRRNQFGNSEHPDTTFVFDKKKKVYGKQNKDGTIDELTDDDIDICNKYKFSYVLPSNLDQKSGFDDIKVDELDEEEELESDQELESDEELESDDIIEEDEEELLEDDEF